MKSKVDSLWNPSEFGRKSKKHVESKGSWREIRRNLKISYSLSFIKFERQYRPNAETFSKFETPYMTKA